MMEIHLVLNSCFQLVGSHSAPLGGTDVLVEELNMWRSLSSAILPDHHIYGYVSALFPPTCSIWWNWRGSETETNTSQSNRTKLGWPQSSKYSTVSLSNHLCIVWNFWLLWRNYFIVTNLIHTQYAQTELYFRGVLPRSREGYLFISTSSTTRGKGTTKKKEIPDVTIRLTTYKDSVNERFQLWWTRSEDFFWESSTLDGDNRSSTWCHWQLPSARYAQHGADLWTSHVADMTLCGCWDSATASAETDAHSQSTARDKPCKGVFGALGVWQLG